MTTPPCLPSFLTLRLFLPILPLHSPSTRGTTKKMESEAQLSQQHRAKPSNFQYLLAAWCLSTSLPNSICMESTTTEGAPVAEGLREDTNGIGDSRKKTTETETRASLAIVYTCRVSGWSIPGKIWKPTNQIRAISAGAHVSRELRARALQASRGI